jgi:hypothetical protein
MYGEKFDLTHSRMMTGSVADWPKLCASAFEYSSRPLQCATADQPPNKLTSPPLLIVTSTPVAISN